MAYDDTTITGLTGHLLATGWENNHTWRGAKVWSHASHQACLLVPAAIEFPDDPDLVRRAVHKLAEIQPSDMLTVVVDQAEKRQL